MISKLDNLVEGGRGDEHYKDLFYTIVSSLCENHATLKDQVPFRMYIFKTDIN